MKKILSASLILCGVFNIFSVGAAAIENTDNKNLVAAKLAYGTEKVIINQTADTLQSDLFEAALEKSSDKSPCIVYIPAGNTYVIEKEKVHNSGSIKAGYQAGVYVPENVILVAEDDVVIKAGSSMQRLVMVSGSVYGGKYDGAKKTYYPLF